MGELVLQRELRKGRGSLPAPALSVRALFIRFAKFTTMDGLVYIFLVLDVLIP